MYDRLAVDIWSQGFTADGTTTIPLERWDVDGPLVADLHNPSSTGSNGSPVHFGVFLANGVAAGFDSVAFSLSPNEALQVDNGLSKAWHDVQPGMIFSTCQDGLCLHVNDGTLGTEECTASGRFLPV